MDGEQLLIYASLLNMLGIAVASVLVWMNRSGRSGGILEADLKELHKTMHLLTDIVNTLPTKESLKLLDAQMRLEIRETEARLLKNAVDLAASLAKTTAEIATALAQTTAAAAAAARGDPR